MDDNPALQRIVPAVMDAPNAFGMARQLPRGLNRRHLVARHGVFMGTVLLWKNRTQVRRQLARLAADAPDASLSDIGTDRARIAREAFRWFWQELELP